MSRKEFPAEPRLHAAVTAGIEEWNRVEPNDQVNASFVASYVDYTRAALEASDQMLTFEGRPCKVDREGKITYREE